MNNARRGNSARNQVKAQRCVEKTHTHTRVLFTHRLCDTHQRGGCIKQHVCWGSHEAQTHHLRAAANSSSPPPPLCLFVRRADAHQATRTPRVCHGTAPAHHPWVSRQRRRHTCMGGDQCCVPGCGRGQTPHLQTTQRRLPAAVYTGGSRGSNKRCMHSPVVTTGVARAHT